MGRSDDLRPENYEQIRKAMLNVRMDRPSAIDDMTRRELCLPHYRDRELPLGNYDTSFTRQIWDVYTNPLFCPDVVVGTVWSGIPPLKAVEGFYEEVGVKTPLFLPLHVNQMLAAEYHSSIPFLCILAQLKAQYLSHHLSGVLRDANVVIVEEYVRSGNCMEICGQIAQDAGARSVVGIRGRWYDNVRHSDVDLRTLNSRHDSFMHNIGRQAANVNIQDSQLQPQHLTIPVAPLLF